MSDIQIIETALARAARRRRWQRAFQGFARGLFAGGLLLLLAIAIFKLAPVPPSVIPGAAVAGSVLALAGLLHGGWRRASALETARWVDDRRQLKERLSTALEFTGTDTRADWQQLLVHDAAKHAQSLKPAEVAPFRFPRVAGYAVLVLALAAGLGFVPAYRTQAQVQKQKDAANISDVGKELADLARRELIQRPPVLAPTQKTMEQVAEFGEKLGKQTLTKSEALKDLASVTDKLAEQQREMEKNPALKPLEKAAREPGGGPSASAESLQKQLDGLQKELGAAAAQPEKLDKLQKDLEKLQQQAANMPAKDSPAGQAAREQMAQSLADLARQAGEAGASLETLDDAIKALESGNVDQFIKDLQAASHDLEKMQQMAKAMQQLQQQMAKMGKDLAEQLEKGQAQAAAQTLQKMIDQLKQGNLTRDQLEQIMQDVAKAVDPAKDYGKVAEHLQKAAQQCQGGDKPGASQSLADAQAELQKLLDQMADSDSLNAMLDALARADQAIRSGKQWSQCQGGGRCSSCAGKGCNDCKGRGWSHGAGKGASGVGTWADDYGWTYASENGGSPVDNSGIVRPDMDSRGHTDRPDDLNPNLAPDKVKGRMSPGGSMPSITLKGVSIPGSSSVRFEEAATAAQQEAQSALNQDQVPRAYQNAVRDYFDDLKK